MVSDFLTKENTLMAIAPSSKATKTFHSLDDSLANIYVASSLPNSEMRFTLSESQELRSLHSSPS